MVRASKLRPSHDLPDHLRCTRNDGRRWRCFNHRIAGKRFCLHHHQSELKRQNLSTNLKRFPTPTFSKLLRSHRDDRRWQRNDGQGPLKRLPHSPKINRSPAALKPIGGHRDDRRCCHKDGEGRLCGALHITGSVYCRLHHHDQVQQCQLRRNHSSKEHLRCCHNKGSRRRCRETCIAGSNYCVLHHQYELSCRPHSGNGNCFPSSPKLLTLCLRREEEEVAVGRVVWVGEIWAVPHVNDGIPRSYARVERIFPVLSMVELSFLELKPSFAIQSLWVATKLPIACGVYVLNPSHRCVKHLSCLSHLIIPQSISAGSINNPVKVFNIYPRSGEIWAVYRECKEKSWDCRCPIYRLVEVVQGFDNERKVTVVELAAEAKGVLRQKKVHCGYLLVRSFSEMELPLFSHRIPVRRIENGNGEHVWEVAWPQVVGN